MPKCNDLLRGLRGLVSAVIIGVISTLNQPLRFSAEAGRGHGSHPSGWLGQVPGAGGDWQ